MVYGQVNEFRQKAIKLISHDKLASQGSIHSPAGQQRLSLAFKERKNGFTVLLLLLPEHHKLARTALRLSRLFVHNIVDRLHIVSDTDAPCGFA